MATKLGTPPKLADFSNNSMNAIDQWFLGVNNNITTNLASITSLTSSVTSLNSSVSTLTTNLSATSAVVSRMEMATLVTPTAAQALTSGVVTKVLLNAVTYNTSGFFNTTTSVFQPTQPGIYKIDLQAAIDLTGGGGPALTAVILELNGVSLAQNNAPVGGTLAVYTPSISFLIQMNGTTDFLEMYAFQNTGVNKNVLVANTYFIATCVRPL